MKDETREKQTFDVFLSHNDKDKPAVRELKRLLSEHGLRVWLDEEQLIPGEKFPSALARGIMSSAAVAACIGPAGTGPWHDEEIQAALAAQKRVLPVILPGAPEKPEMLLFLTARMWVDLRAGFTKDGILRVVWGILWQRPAGVETPSQRADTQTATTGGGDIFLYAPEDLVGRDAELAALDQAWNNPSIRVLTIVAWPGVGKTSLVAHWMVSRDVWNRPDFERVFDWSFHSQGTREQGAASSDSFIAAAFEFFGGQESRKLAASSILPGDKGARLARLVAQRRTLLVLDGLETLQYPPGAGEGKLKDEGLAALLRGLAEHNTGLCLVTTRVPLADLRTFHHTSAPQWWLEHLSEAAGAQLLFEMGVKRAGNAEIEVDDPELKDAAREVGGHALTLQLLGRYLAKAYNGDIRQRQLVAFQKADEKIQGGHAFRMMAAYEEWLGGGGEEGKKQLAVLYLLGLFNGPAHDACLTALRRRPAIDGLTEPLVDLGDDEWNFTLSNLVECRLISCRGSPAERASCPSAVDCHPLVREHFGKRLRDKHPDAWREAHRRLYEHLTHSTEYQPDTLAGLAPLYQAVAHGCQAGLHQEAWTEVFWKRIQRGPEVYAGKRVGTSAESPELYGSKRLGAFSDGLSALSWFFTDKWHKPVATLGGEDGALVLQVTGIHLRALGRLPEAVAPLRAAMEARAGLGLLEKAAESGGHLSEVLMTLGKLEESVQYARESMAWADTSRNVFWRVDNRTTLANTLHQMGDRREAESLFREAEKMQRQSRVSCPQLETVRGFWYCDLLLTRPSRMAWQFCLTCPDRPENARVRVARKMRSRGVLSCLTCCREIEKRARRTLNWGHQHKSSVLALALDGLTLSRIALYKVILRRPGRACRRGTKAAFSRAMGLPIHRLLDPALDGLRRSGMEDFIPWGLLTHAWLDVLEGDAGRARADLDEAWQIVERGSMRLFMADVLLQRGRLLRDKPALSEARKLIADYGYHRRDAELRDAERAAQNW